MRCSKEYQVTTWTNTFGPLSHLQRMTLSPTIDNRCSLQLDIPYFLRPAILTSEAAKISIQPISGGECGHRL